MEWGHPFPALSAALFGLDAFRGVGHFHQPLLGNELSGRFADAVRLVLDAYERHFEVADKFHLMGSQTTAFLFGKSCGALLQHLERRRCVFRIVVGGMGDRGAQQLVVRTRVLKLFQDKLPELFEFGVAVSGSLDRKSVV